MTYLEKERIRAMKTALSLAMSKHLPVGCDHEEIEAGLFWREITLMASLGNWPDPSLTIAANELMTEMSGMELRD